MSYRLAVIMDPIESISIKKDSTFAMILEAQTRNYELFYVQQGDLFLKQGKAFAKGCQLQVYDNLELWYEFKTESEVFELADMDVILMRKDPPFNMDYVYSTYILEQAEREGVLVVNKPQSLRDANEKLFTVWFQQWCPDTLVTSNSELLREFLAEHRDLILKPLDGMGGVSIFRVKENDPNIGVIFETLTENGSQLAMAQRFIPEISAGDKRVLIIDGVPVPYVLARVPSKGETRGNLAVGGKAVPQVLSKQDEAMALDIGSELKKRGLIFVGIDVIGDRLTEINVTSPTCIRELDEAFNINISAQLFDAIESKLNS